MSNKPQKPSAFLIAPPPRYLCKIHGEHGAYVQFYYNGVDSGKRWCMHCLEAMFERFGVLNMEKIKEDEDAT